MKKLLKFLLSGGIGFLTDAGLTAGLIHSGLAGPLVARAIAITIAMAVTWYINRTFTFGASKGPVASEGFRYGAVGITSAVLNYALYAALLSAIPHLQPLAALVMASVAAMAWSYFGYSRFVFRR